MRGKGRPENASCRYKGVRQRVWGTWVSEISEPNRGVRIWLGSFDNSESAAMAYDEAAIRIFGPTAELNFSDRLPQVSVPGQPTAATSTVHTIFTEEEIEFFQKALTDMQLDGYPPGDEVSLICNPYACLVNDYVYDYYADQFKLFERKHSVAPITDLGVSQGNSIVHNVGYQKENCENIKDKLRVESQGYKDFSFRAGAIETSDLVIKDPGAVITITGNISQEYVREDWEGELGISNFWL